MGSQHRPLGGGGEEETSKHLIPSKTMSDTDGYTNAENCHAQVIILNNVYILNVDFVFIY